MRGQLGEGKREHWGGSGDGQKKGIKKEKTPQPKPFQVTYMEGLWGGPLKTEPLQK